VERLSPEDARILRLESSTVAGHTLKVLILEQPPGGPRLGVGELRDHIAARLDSAPRLRQRVEPPAGGPAPPAWVDDDGFDIAHHVRRSPVTEGTDGLRAHVGRVMSERLDRGRPLWTLDLVDGLDEGDIALVLKLHHAMADGTGALRIASTVLWDSGVNPADGSPSASRAGGDVHPAPLVRALARRRRWQELLRETRSLPTAVERELSPRATPSPFARPVGTWRAVAFAAVPLAEARTIKESAPASPSMTWSWPSRPAG
jgi:diacylglycerol O-acyltransferase / wax synthase